MAAEAFVPVKLYRIESLRRLMIPLFSKLNPGDITIKHHYTGQPFRLHSFRHKGYWYHGRNRERATMDMFARLLQPGDHVYEVGGHIGYITLFFAHWVGPRGSVHVFEPGTNNLPYIRANIHETDNIELIEKAVSSENGTATFFLEDLTGQNNTLIPSYEVFERNRKKAHVGTDYRTTEVEMVTIDSFLESGEPHPDFVKIDVEGAELDVLRGMSKTLREDRPGLMVEVTKAEDEVFQLIKELDYVLFRDDCTELTDPSEVRGNVFGLHRQQHERVLAGLGIR